MKPVPDRILTGFEYDDLKQKEQMLLNLLAVVHRDGGHYTEKFGIHKSVHDAEKKVMLLIHESEVMHNARANSGRRLCTRDSDE